MSHISIDRKHKLIRHFEVTDAALADTHVFDVLIDPDNTSADIWTDAIYRSKPREQSLKEEGCRSYIHTKGQVNEPGSDYLRRANRKRSKARYRVEYVLAAQQTMGGKLVRVIGLERARVKVALTNIV